MPQSLADPLTAWERAGVEMTWSSNLAIDTLTGLVPSSTSWRLNYEQRWQPSRLPWLSALPEVPPPEARGQWGIALLQPLLFRLVPSRALRRGRGIASPVCLPAGARELPRAPQRPQPSLRRHRKSRLRSKGGRGRRTHDVFASTERGGRVQRGRRKRTGGGKVWESRSQAAEGFRSAWPALGAIALSGAVSGETRSAVNPGMRGNGNCA